MTSIQMKQTNVPSAVPPSATVLPSATHPATPATGPSATTATTIPAVTENASLYVGELEQSVTEGMQLKQKCNQVAVLFELFNPMGPVASIRVCRDAVTRRSLGYAYVNYHNVADGEKALAELNYYPLKNQPIRIMWSQRDPSMRRTGTGNIFIKNLDSDIDNKALHDTFSVFGHILSCKIVNDESGPKGYGFVHFAEADAADAAIQSVNGMLINDKKVFVGHHVSRKERQSKIDESRQKYTNVYVKNLPEQVTDEEFTEMFSKFGITTSCVIARNEDGVSKGFGFINYEKSENAHAAVEALNDSELHGKQLYVGRAQKKAEREDDLKKQYEKLREEKISAYQGVNLYIKNLDESITEDILRQEFSSCGSIVSCRIMKDENTEVSKGFGFVCFSAPEEATKAVTELNGKMLSGKPIYVALAQRKEVRHQLLANQMQQRAQMRMQQPMQGVPGYQGAPMFYPQQQQRGVYFQQQQPGMRPRYPQQTMPMNYMPLPGMPQQPQGYPVQSQQGIRPQQQRPGQRPPYNMQFPAQQQGNASGRGRGGYKYTPNARNAPQQNRKLNPAALASLPVEEQKRVLGEALFPLVSNVCMSLGKRGVEGKITGMLLEIDLGELLLMIENGESLEESCKEAIQALEEQEQGQQE